MVLLVGALAGAGAALKLGLFPVGKKGGAESAAPAPAKLTRMTNPDAPSLRATRVRYWVIVFAIIIKFGQRKQHSSSRGRGGL